MQTTRREVEHRNSICIEVGYCNLTDTLRECADGKDGYTAGVYGWNADIYEFGSFAIVTGYRPFGKDILSHEFCKRWERKAKAHYDKVNAPNERGQFRSPVARARMRLTFRSHFSKAVEAEIEKWLKRKEKKGRKVA